VQAVVGRTVAQQRQQAGVELLFLRLIKGMNTFFNGAFFSGGFFSAIIQVIEQTLVKLRSFTERRRF